MFGRRIALLGAVFAAFLSILPGVLPNANAAGDTGRYVGAGTTVGRANGQTAADDGTVVCDDGEGVGTGGVCLAFGGGDAVEVADQALRGEVAFQVCIDNDGDGFCTSPSYGPCADQIFFSHDDAGQFFNPIGPLPTGFAPGCYGGPWKGYVVLLCQGAHAAGTSVHTHEATSGTASVTTGGQGFGTFCGGTPQQVSRKPYTVGSGARYMSGGTAVARNDGQPAVDDGSVVCNNGDNVGVGGFCTSFGGGDAMAVFDAAAGTDVAFQVCVDNSGDGVCTSPDNSWNCPDQVFFSHDDAGNFYNPLGPLPTGFAPGCAGGPWKGYVVFLCEGAHVKAGAAHTHAATTGTGRVTTGGEGTGNFCGGTPAQPSGKRYAVDTRPPAPPRVPGGPGVTSADGTCNLKTGSDETLTGGQDTFTGTLSGTLVEDDTATHSLRCFVTVDGVEVASTPTGSGTGTVSTIGEVTFNAAEGSSVEACAETDAVVLGCTPASTQQAVPQELQDLLDQADATAQATADAAEDAAGNAGDDAKVITDPVLCPLLAAFAPGVPGVVDISPQGDVTLPDGKTYDCPPLGS
jgi:hypothetical protein